MPGVREVHKLATFKNYVRIGTALATPEDLQILEHATNRLAPSSNVEPMTLFALMVAGAVGNRLVAAIDDAVAKLPLPADHPAGTPPPRPPWADAILEAIGLQPRAALPTGPVSSLEELHARAAAAGLALP